MIGREIERGWERIRTKEYCKQNRNGSWHHVINKVTEDEIKMNFAEGMAKRLWRKQNSVRIWQQRWKWNKCLEDTFPSPCPVTVQSLLCVLYILNFYFTSDDRCNSFCWFIWCFDWIGMDWIASESIRIGSFQSHIHTIRVGEKSDHLRFGSPMSSKNLI